MQFSSIVQEEYLQASNARMFLTEIDCRLRSKLKESGGVGDMSAIMIVRHLNNEFDL